MNKKVYIKQDGTIPGRRIVEELERRGGKNEQYYKGMANNGYYAMNELGTICCFSEKAVEDYTELLYNKETDSFYEKNDCSGCTNDKGCINCKDGDMKETKSQRMVSAEAKEALLPDAINEGEYAIPEGYEAKVEDGKVIVKKKKWQPKEGDKIYSPNYYFLEKQFYVMEGTVNDVGALDIDIFPTKEECQAFCDKLNNAISQILEERRKEVQG